MLQFLSYINHQQQNEENEAKLTAFQLNPPSWKFIFLNEPRFIFQILDAQPGAPAPPKTVQPITNKAAQRQVSGELMKKALKDDSTKFWNALETIQ